MTCRLSPSLKAKYAIRRIYMHADVRFALIASLSPGLEPSTFTDLKGLCRRIHKLRGTAALQLKPYTLHLYGDPPEGRRAVAVYVLAEDSSSERFVGWAWLDGGDWRQLRSALFALKPDTAIRAEAA